VSGEVTSVSGMVTTARRAITRYQCQLEGMLSHFSSLVSLCTRVDPDLTLAAPQLSNPVFAALVWL
jgi:hypothetical protein